jgi:hypothetical protein
VTAIHGSLEVDGRLARPERVIAVAGDPATVVGAGAVSDDGGFEITLTARVERVIVMAGVSEPVLGVVHAAVDLDSGPATVALALDTREGFHVLACELELPGPWPPFVALTVDPLHLAGVPAALEPLMRRRDERVADASFLRLQLRESTFALTVQEGTYRVDASYVDRNRPNLARPEVENVVTALVRVDGEEAHAAGPFAGVRLTVSEPTRLALVLRVLPDEELLRG